MRVGSCCEVTARLIFARSLGALPLPRLRASPSSRGAFYAPSQFRPNVWFLICSIGRGMGLAS
jgi:hypothetical protein